MAGTNNFLPFDSTKGNILNDASYSASSIRQNGVVNGLADAQTANKVWYQTSVMAAAIAQFIANNGQNASDADVATLTASFLAALQSASALVNQTNPKLGALLDRNGHSIEGAEYDNGNSGTAKTIYLDNGNSQKLTVTGNVVITLVPPTKSCWVQIRFINDGVSNHTITLPNTIKWVYKVAPVFTATALAEDTISLFWVPETSNYRGHYGLNYG